MAARWAILIKLNFLYIAPVMKPTFHFSAVVDRNVQAQVAQWQDLGRRSDADRFWWCPGRYPQWGIRPSWGPPEKHLGAQWHWYSEPAVQCASCGIVLLGSASWPHGSGRGSPGLLFHPSAFYQGHQRDRHSLERSTSETWINCNINCIYLYGGGFIARFRLPFYFEAGSFHSCWLVQVSNLAKFINLQQELKRKTKNWAWCWQCPTARRCFINRKC